MSPPSRAAWIEITGSEGKLYDFDGRRLHGRRGLKWVYVPYAFYSGDVAAFTGGVD